MSNTSILNRITCICLLGLGYITGISAQLQWTESRAPYPMVKTKGAAYKNGKVAIVGLKDHHLLNSKGVALIGDQQKPHEWYRLWQPVGTDYNLNSIETADTQFITVGDKGTIFTCSNDSSWISRPSGVKTNLRDLIWADSQIVVVGDSGTILTSPDGITWTAKSSGVKSRLNDVIWSDSQFVAVGDSGTVLTSPDGNSWSPQETGISYHLTSIAWNGQIYAVSTGTVSYLLSHDAKTWSVQETGLRRTWFSHFTCIDNYFYAFVNEDIFISQDGVEWNFHYTTNYCCLEGFWFKKSGPYVYIGYFVNDDSNVDIIQYSQDCVSWSSVL